eukprot:2024467-Rhodomonas_salina.3
MMRRTQPFFHSVRAVLLTGSEDHPAHRGAARQEAVPRAGGDRCRADLRDQLDPDVVRARPALAPADRARVRLLHRHAPSHVALPLCVSPLLLPRGYHRRARRLCYRAWSSADPPLRPPPRPAHR